MSNAVSIFFKEPVNMGFAIQKAKDADVLVYTKETFAKSTDIYVHPLQSSAVQLSHTNPQQSGYNWGTAELFKWKAYTGKETEGILYKPEDFDAKKKYPMIVYFYERGNSTLYNYQAPSPTPSRLNIPFFVSRGYIVFVPDIWYKTGYPGQGAYDHILSGTRAVVKQGYVDSTKIGLQGQSWGGYQIVYLITKTNLYAAAWAGAPVANMTSAYGGIRWGSGLTRQFQYEKTQSRIGATLWEKPNLYIQNSALFSLPKVKTPLVIMANDADDAVPWYQGIEMYTGMRRLGKKVWMLTYNGEAHNLIERKNRKDIQIREQQFFDYMLKGDKPAKWITDGVPAVMKGRDLGLGY
jgi:dipeptidyl aminopeptidase/acylaminoacyl peptidase